MTQGTDRRLLGPAEVEAVLRRAAEFNARRWATRSEGHAVAPEAVVRAAGMAGIPEECVRRALWELDAERAADPPTLARKIYGPSRIKVRRELPHPREAVEDHLESLARLEHGLRLRMKNPGVLVWEAGGSLGAVRRALDLSGGHALLKARSVELRAEEPERGRCVAALTADVSDQRAECLTLSAILGVTLAMLFVLAGFQNGFFLLGVLPAFAAPVAGFRLFYVRTRAEVWRQLEALLDAAEQGPPEEQPPPDRTGRPPGHIQGLEPIPRFSPNRGRGGTEDA
ncbi:hypothetical protein RxyAA322_05290 [Rubrobacter xylanophilus]|uniref:Uncharacterized protein n=1 Tax=Rubrobacter xylanophilus TaxID=49319 RepID=A0A510HHD8_9ACTN|nr:hypothetical protein [Rubrobacter xylanophilus]BBL78675.1 hypothetical protein RxyAA322_05290 [Rubrobacter xylanophilus]